MSNSTSLHGATPRPSETDWGRLSRAVPAVLFVLFLLPGRCPYSDGGEPAGTSGHLRYDQNLFQSGDLLFRRGDSMLSHAVLQADQQSEYSHVGIVSIEDGKVWVIHSVPQEDDRPGNGVRADQLGDFLSPSEAVQAAVFRSADQRAAIVATRAALDFARKRLPFDGAFDLTTADRVYCTELVWRAYLKAGIDLRPPGSTARYLYPSDLVRSPRMQLIATFREVIEP